MFAHLPSHVLDYAILQVAVSNGGKTPYTVRPEDFTFERTSGAHINAAPARTVVSALIDKGGRGDVVKLVSTYESALYGITRLRPTNGYEQRRQQFLAEVASTKIKAAAAASAIALVQTKLAAGQSTDGAVFFPDRRQAARRGPSGDAECRRRIPVRSGRAGIGQEKFELGPTQGTILIRVVRLSSPLPA